MRSFFRELDTIGGCEAAVLIEGETGVGKSRVARALHDLGSRSHRPFVALNGATLPEELFESELFGHRRGAFSGAYQHHPGLARSADGGTLFIDEIGELSLGSQVKLLSFLDHQEVRPVGGLRAHKVDVRLIAATNQDLGGLVRAGIFRRDLYYRLRVLPLRVPALRERQGDLPLLATHFLEVFNRRYRKSIAGLSRDALRRLEEHPWEGNVRELRNEIERAVVLTPDGAVIAARTLRLDSIQARRAPPGGLHDARMEAERSVISAALERHRWNVSAVARELGVSRVGLTRKLKRLGLKRPRGPSGSVARPAVQGPPPSC